VSKQAEEAAQRGAGGVVLGGPLASALAERCLGATGLSRWDGCSSVNVIGAQALRRRQASTQISTWARTRSSRRWWMGRSGLPKRVDVFGASCRRRSLPSARCPHADRVPTGSTGVCSLVGDP